MAIEKVYKFKGIEGLYADAKGQFYFKEKPLKKIYNNGSEAVRVGNTKYGIKKLRTKAYVAFIEFNRDLPF